MKLLAQLANRANKVFIFDVCLGKQFVMMRSCKTTDSCAKTISRVKVFEEHDVTRIKLSSQDDTTGV